MANLLPDTFEHGEVNTLLCAINSFKSQMTERYALGGDQTGECMRRGYLHQCDRLLKAITELQSK